MTQQFRTPMAIMAALGLLGLMGCALASAAAQSPTDMSTTSASTAEQQASENYKILSKSPNRLIAQLPNRMIVVAQRIPTSPVASVQMWVKAGSIYEGEHVGSGLSHFLEHLLSGGSTTTRTEKQSNEILGNIGAQVNAATTYDAVHYYINTSAEHVGTAMELMSDWMQHSTIPMDEYKRERQVIQREFAMGRGEPGRILWKLTARARYDRHPARHPVIGYLEDFLDVSRDEIYHYYQQMYVPNNMIFVVVGKINPRKVIEKAASLWADVPAQPLPTIKLPVEPEIEHPKTVVGHADIAHPRIRLAWPGTKLGGPGDYALDLLARILGQGELSRLVQVVRDKKQLVTSIEAFNASFSWGEGFIAIDAVTTKENLKEAKQAILKVVERIREHGVTQQELQRAKNKTIAEVVYNAQTVREVAAQLGSNLLRTGNPDYLEHYAQAIRNISAQEVQQAAREYLDPQKLITVKLLPAEGELEILGKPEAPPMKKAADWEMERVKLDNRRIIRELKLREQPDKQQDQPIEVGPIKRFVLDNGLTLLVQRNTRLPIVAMQWYQLGGLLADEPGEQGVAHAMAQMMIKGTEDRSAQEIARTLAKLGAQLNTDAGNNTFYARALSLSKDWPTVLHIMADVIQEPTFPKEQWQRMKQRILASIEAMDNTWYGELRLAFLDIYFDDYIWSEPPIGKADVVEDLTAKELQRFHRRHLSASKSVLAVFGDVKVQKVVEKVKKWFDRMPTHAEVPVNPKPHPPVEPQLVQVHTDKLLSAVRIGYAPGIARDNKDYPAMLVMNRVLSSFPVGWFDRALRGRGGGLVYAVGSGMMAGEVPGYWVVLFNTRPKTLPEAMRKALDVIRRIHTQTISPDTLQRARAATLVRQALLLQSNSQRASEAALNELYGVPYQSTEAFINQIRQVTAADVKRVANKYLVRPVAVILTHEKIAPSKLPSLKTWEGEGGEGVEEGSSAK